VAVTLLLGDGAARWSVVALAWPEIWAFGPHLRSGGLSPGASVLLPADGGASRGEDSEIGAMHAAARDWSFTSPPRRFRQSRWA
jgi:hypothetical protein